MKRDLTPFSVALACPRFRRHGRNSVENIATGRQLPTAGMQWSRAVHAELPRRRANLQPDVTAAHDDEPLARAEFRPDALNIFDSPQGVNPLKVGPWGVELARSTLRMWTIWAAESTYQAFDRGSITAGKLGDFAILSADPHKLQPHELFSLKVDATVLGGKVVFGQV